MQEQKQQLNKTKAKVEKDKTVIMHDIADACKATDDVARSKASSEISQEHFSTLKRDKGNLLHLQELDDKNE